MTVTQNKMARLLSRPSVLLLFAFVAFALLSRPALDGPLVLDSTKLTGIERQVLNDPDTSTLNPPRFGDDLWRIVTMATFTANIEIEGGLVSSSIKAVNAGIHCLTALAVFFLASLIFKQSSYQQDAARWALVIAVCWLFAPINFNTAMYAIQRMAQLSTLFCLIGMIVYLLGRTQKRVGHALIYYAVFALLALPLAVFSKENGILLPAFALLIELYLFGAARTRLKTCGLLIACGIIGLAAVALVASLYPALIDYSHLDYSLSERLLSQPRAMVSYMQQILVPVGSDIGVYHDDFVASRSLTMPLTTLLSILVMLMAVLACLFLVNTRYHLAAFGLAFFLLGHLVESTFLPLELYYPHRNYLPGIGLFIALISLLDQLIRELRLKYFVIAALIIWFSVVSYSRSLVWADSNAIAINSLYYHPDSPRALSNYAQQALTEGRLNESLAAVNHAIAVHGGLNYRIQKIYLHCLSGHPLSARDVMQSLSGAGKSLAIETSQALGNLHMLYEQGHCSQLPVLILVEALDKAKTSPAAGSDNVWPIEYYAALFLLLDGHNTLAEKRLSVAMEDGTVEAGLFLLDHYLQQERISEARDLARRMAETQQSRMLEKQMLAHFRELQQQAENRNKSLEP